ncbi:MAG TPA: magnesium transporter [Candidatus Pullichristensenella stercoripullorum]|nr:magnesium transporter [Candidatus Pullichristensenella stercoripullorum]
MDFEKIRARLDKLVAEGRKGELRGALSMLNEVDIAEYMEELDNEKMLMVFRLLPKDIAADVFAYMDADQRQRVIEAMDDNEAVRLVDDMFIDDAVDFLEELPAGVVKRVLKGCDAEKRALINQFLRYPENSAGSIMTIEYMELHVGTTVGEAMGEIRRTGLDKETIYTLYVLDAQRKLLGTLPLRKLLLAQDDVKVETLMNQQFVCVHTTDDQELVADTVRKYDLISIPVVDHEERMIGIITIDDIVDVIEEENTEDFEKMAAMLPSEDEYLKTGVLTLAKNRMPWLLFLMISAIFTGMIITHYEDALKTSAFGVVLTACIPMLMGAGGNCGSQASTLTIRGLALGEVELKDIFKLLWKEVRVGLIVGAVLSLVTFALYTFWLGDMDATIAQRIPTALTIAVAVYITVIVAKAIGCTLPLLAKAVHLDPALMASPLITTIVDICSLLVLFSVATEVLHV